MQFPKETLTKGAELEKTMQTSLERIAEKAKREKSYRFRNLSAMLSEEFIHESWKMLNKKAAYGVDKISYEEYNKDIVKNIAGLVERLKKKSYKAKLVKRKYIDKGNGKTRPLGIPATEDKLLQHAVKRILEAIYEQDFYPNSYGYRPNRSCHEAIKDIKESLATKRFKYVVEADIKGYFDNLDHEWIVKMLEQRVNDQSFIRLIKKWLKAGVLETDGKVIHPATGSPQGGIISPMLANIYMHYVLTLWFEKVVKKNCKGEAKLFVYADDFICIFENEYDARRFYKFLGERLGKFNLTLSPEKTNLIDFRLESKSSFDFLGFEFRWGKEKWKPLRTQTSKKKLQKSKEAFKEWCKSNRSMKIKDFFKILNMKLRGYYNYYGIKGNSKGIAKFYRYVELTIFKWLNRRSQRKSYNWEGFTVMMKYFEVLRPRVVQSF